MMSLCPPMTYTVADIQKLLIDCGFKITFNGKIDQPTTHAIKTFQGSQGLRQDGLVGPLSWVRLKAFAALWGRY